jgi:hypothetical protein
VVCGVSTHAPARANLHGMAQLMGIELNQL